MSAMNPFDTGCDRHAIWEILMTRDFQAFVAADWLQTQDDFLEDEFYGVDAGKLSLPDQWMLRYPDLASYREEWLRQAVEFQNVDLTNEDKLHFLFSSIKLNEIEIEKSRAIARKKFDGRMIANNGETIALNWQTLYYLKKIGHRWKIVGFTGYLPFERP